uniref:Uncharacterized protein n=1 Tax=Neogobius melanostomus TaxID=47308 RepID=A0A8C6SLE2_9GOBI
IRTKKLLAYLSLPVARYEILNFQSFKEAQTFDVAYSFWILFIFQASSLGLRLVCLCIITICNYEETHFEMTFGENTTGKIFCRLMKF